MKLRLPSVSPAPLIRLLGLAAALIVFGIGVVRNLRLYHDDAYITLRYARNFLAGQGLVWNPGERVEGYTNFLHLLLTSGLSTLGVGLKPASQIIGFGAFLLALGAVYAYTGRPGLRGSPWRALPLMSLIGSVPLSLNALAGLESVLYSALLTVGICLTLALSEAPAGRLAASAGLAFAFACMTRIEGGLFFAISWLFLWLQSRRLRPPAYLLGMGLVFGTVFGAYFLWRWGYYGAFLPNTFYVKTGRLTLERIANGSFYVMSYMVAPPFLFPAAAGALALAHRRRAVTPQMAYLAALIGAFLAYVAYVGGDYIHGFRFIVPVIPAASLLLFLALAGAAPAPARPPALPYAAAALALALQMLGPSAIWPLIDPASLMGEVIGRHIDQHWEDDSLIALNAAGAAPYFAPQQRFIDMLGLNDAHIGRLQIGELRLPAQIMPGHSKGDGAYVLSRRPDYIILGPVSGTDAANPLFLSDLELAETPAFLAQYRQRQITFDLAGLPNYELLREDGRPVLLFTYYELIK